MQSHLTGISTIDTFGSSRGGTVLSALLGSDRAVSLWEALLEFKPHEQLMINFLLGILSEPVSK